jgi:hypothetical protein
MRLQLLRSYKELTEPLNMTLSEPDFVEHYLENYEAQHKIRAAIALRAIGGADAKQALAGIPLSLLREDVRRAVEQSLSKLSDPAP